MGELSGSERSASVDVMDMESGPYLSSSAMSVPQTARVDSGSGRRRDADDSHKEYGSETELVDACRKGCNHARERVYHAHYSRIRSLMVRMTGDYEEALDLSQEAIMQVLDRIDSFRGKAVLGTWIHRVAVNEALQHLRRRKRHRQITNFIDGEPRCSDPVSNDPAVPLDVHEALDKLPAKCRQMVQLRYWDELTYAEIGRILGVKAGTVASGLDRARKQLRQILDYSRAV